MMGLLPVSTSEAPVVPVSGLVPRTTNSELKNASETHAQDAASVVAGNDAYDPTATKDQML